MSWNDTGSRPKKSEAIPPPYYLTVPDPSSLQYCHTCGRIISSKKPQSAGKESNKKQQKQQEQQQVKYCGNKCKAHRPRKDGIETRVEQVFVALLNGHTVQISENGEVTLEDSVRTKKDKGQHKGGKKEVVVGCEEVERIVFGRKTDDENNGDEIEEEVDGRGSLDSLRSDGDHRPIKSDEELGEGTIDDSIGSIAQKEDDEHHTVDSTSSTLPNTNNDGDNNDDDPFPIHPSHLKNTTKDNDQPPPQSLLTTKTRTRLPQTISLVNGSIGGEKSRQEHAQLKETPEMLARRLQGQKKVAERETVRNVARRGCAFGFDMGGEKRRFVDAVMKEKVVEASFAKGEWGVKWRE